MTFTSSISLGVVWLTIFYYASEMSAVMGLTSSECAVVGCGVLGTSLCKQILASPEFSDWQGENFLFVSKVYVPGTNRL